jgi:ERCC4-related helicase
MAVNESGDGGDLPRMSLASPTLSISSDIQPREYQLNIASKASKSNTLVILPTGLGKTIVAILVARARLAPPEEGLKKEVRARVLVLAPTKPLVVQHRETFMKAFSPSFSESSFVVLTGESSAEERSKSWLPVEEAEGSKFVFATPETVLNDLNSGRGSLEDFVLMVFDEAHRCVKDYAYTEVARMYMEYAKDPLILGLTASPGSSTERIEEVKQNLFIQNVEARTEEDIDVSPYVEGTNISAIRVKLPSEFTELILRPLGSLHSEKLEKLRKAGLIPSALTSKRILLESRSAILSRLNYADKNSNARAYLYGLLIAQSQAVMIQHAIELTETQGLHTLSKYLEKMRRNPEQGKSAKALLKDERWVKVEESAKKLLLKFPLAHPKIGVLKLLVREQLEPKEDSKIIVFTQYRDTIDAIISSLSSSTPPSSLVRPQRFVGQSTKSDHDKGMSQKLQTEILDKFRRGNEFNVLVSSSIGEEGLHVPDVDLVVFYEAVPSEIRSIQRKGRTGRTMPGRVVILLAEGTVDESYYYTTMSKERRMKKLLSKREEAGMRSLKSPEKDSGNATLLDFLG